jgi:hypothetical protein
MSISKQENSVRELENEGAGRGYEEIDKDHWPEGGKIPDSSWGLKKGSCRACLTLTGVGSKAILYRDHHD